MRMLPLLLLVPLVHVGPAVTQAQAPAPGAIDRAFVRLYNFDFAGAHRLLDEHARADPGDPLTFAVRAGAHLFEEFDRLRILQVDFFLNDDHLVDTKPLDPDPEKRQTLFEAVEQARSRAATRLAVDPNDRNALFAMCMTAGIVADYTGFVERRQWRGVRLARETRRYAGQLLSLDPPMYDAHYATGTLEYLVGSLPFYIRWFVRFDRIEGNKEKAVDELTLVARHGRYYGPFARVILSVIALREGRLEDARALLAGLTAEFPENPLLLRELRRVTARIETTAKAKRR